MTARKVELSEREVAEIRRSAYEAELTAHEDLRYSERTIQRYLDPPEATAFALEYAYYLLGDVRGKAVLDLGCGSGENTVLLARRGADVQALDISDSLVDLAKKRLVVNGVREGVTFHVGSAHALPFPDCSIDVVFGMAILHHLDLELTSREVWRVLRPGGYAIFKEPMRNSRLLAFLRRLVPWQHPDVSPFERPLRDDELRRFARDFSRYQERAFALPYVSVAEVLPGVPSSWIYAAHRFDRQVLLKAPRLSFYATTKVMKMVK
jgi:ubiquinone/menaquinone biosynthesis C-methylase UbiE